MKISGAVKITCEISASDLIGSKNTRKSKHGVVGVEKHYVHRKERRQDVVYGGWKLTHIGQVNRYTKTAADGWDTLGKPADPTQV